MNVELGNLIIKQITEYPETHDQRFFYNTKSSCGTTACIAGWACLLSGYQIEQDDAGYSYLRSENGSVNGIAVTAKELLGLNETQAFELFYLTTTSNAVFRLQRMIDNYIANQ